MSWQIVCQDIDKVRYALSRGVGVSKCMRTLREEQGIRQMRKLVPENLAELLVGDGHCIEIVRNHNITIVQIACTPKWSIGDEQNIFGMFFVNNELRTSICASIATILAAPNCKFGIFAIGWQDELFRESFNLARILVALELIVQWPIHLAVSDEHLRRKCHTEGRFAFSRRETAIFDDSTPKNRGDFAIYGRIVPFVWWI